MEIQVGQVWHQGGYKLNIIANVAGLNGLGYTNTSNNHTYAHRMTRGDYDTILRSYKLYNPVKNRAYIVSNLDK